MVVIQRSRGVAALLMVLLTLVISAAADPTINIAPYEPVVIEVPIAQRMTQSVQGQLPLPLPVLLKTPDGNTESFSVPSEGMLGVKVSPNGSESALWLITTQTQLSEDIFVSPGIYHIQIDTSPPSIITVTVAQPSVEEATFADLLKGDVLTRISLIKNGTEINPATKSVCEQILERAPFSRYAEYAKSYLAVDRYYASQQALDPTTLIGKAAPDLASSAKGLVSDLRGLEPTNWPLRGMVLYYRGFAHASAGDTESAVSTLQTLTSQLRNSPWSHDAETLVTQIGHETSAKTQEAGSAADKKTMQPHLSAATASPTPSSRGFVEPSKSDHDAVKWTLVSLCVVSLLAGAILILRNRRR